MSRTSIAKSVIATVLVAVWTPEWIRAEFQQDRKITLVAASTEMSQRGVKTYRVFSPIMTERGTQIAADLIGANNNTVGRWEEIVKVDKSWSQSTLRYDGRELVGTITMPEKQMTLTLDGKMIATGTPGNADPEAVQRLVAIRYLIEVDAWVRRDVEAALKEAVALGAEWYRASFAPRPVQGAIVAFFRLLPKPGVVYAASLDEGPGCEAPTFHHCGSCVHWWESTACACAHNSAG